MQLSQTSGVHHGVGSAHQEHGYAVLLGYPSSTGDDLARGTIAPHGIDCDRESGERLTGWSLAAASH